MKNNPRTGIFGLTADPFTVAHMAIVNESLRQGFIDRLVIVPTVVNYYKKHKLHMFNDAEIVEIIRVFIDTSPYKDSIIIDSSELQNKSRMTLDELESRRYINMICSLESVYGSNLITIIGLDSLKNFKTWHKWREILEKTRLLVANRQADDFSTDIPYEKLNIPLEYDLVSSTRIREKLNNMQTLKNSVFQLYVDAIKHDDLTILFA